MLVKIYTGDISTVRWVQIPPTPPKIKGSCSLSYFLSLLSGFGRLQDDGFE